MLVATEVPIARTFYQTLQRVEFDDWAVLAGDLLLNSPVGAGIRGLGTFKDSPSSSPTSPSGSTS
jgi:hypothetical protein